MGVKSLTIMDHPGRDPDTTDTNPISTDTNPT